MATRPRPLTVEDLVQRATAGRKFNRHTLYRPSLTYYLIKDPFWIWCEYHAARDAAVDETTRYDKLRMEQGIAHEVQWVRLNHPEAVTIEPSFGFEALKNTFRAMLDGAPAIYQPQLWDLGRDTYGKGDLLIRDDGLKSELGPFHYRVVELKRSATLQEYHILQAAFYNQIVGLLQGYVPDELTVVLKHGGVKAAYQGKDRDLDSLRRSWRSLREGDEAPESKRPPDAARSPWRIYANQRAIAERDLVLLAGIQKREREKLRAAGIRRVDQLWNLNLDAAREIIGDHYGPIAYYVARAYKDGGPIPKPGHRLEIPRARRLLYFDFETSDGVHPTEPPHTYLIGCYDGNRDQFVQFLARGADDEGRIFEEFLDYVGDPCDTLLYHWTDFEIRQMRTVMGRWPTVAASLERLIERCVDLKVAIQSALYLPVPSFSIKSVAPALGFHWRQKDVGAYQSMVSYWDFLENRDLFAIDRAIIYNEDDCRAMWHVDHELATRLNAQAASA